jgi:serine/threonine-protein kinase
VAAALLEGYGWGHIEPFEEGLDRSFHVREDSIVIGQTLGPYRVLDKLGEGAMGEVYKARDTRLGRTVALKVLPERLASDEQFKRRFEREARTVSKLNHPHVCALYDIGEQDGIGFLVMEYVDGETLAARLARDGSLPLDDAVRYARQIADALDAAHQQGVVHRDLKPGNVMLTRSGAKVLDFGIAARATSADTETFTRSIPTDTTLGMVAGTLPYMSPEALRGEPPDARSDVWAFGVLLQEMTTGARPFGGETAAVITSAILRDPPTPLPDDSPDWLRRIISRCLARDLGDRYQRAGEVRAVLDATTGSATPVTQEFHDPGTRRHRLTAAAAAGVVVATVAGWVALGDRDVNTVPAGADSDITSLAVLPLDNMSGDPDQEYLSDGMTETLITELATLGSVRVISRTSVMTYKDAQRSVPEIARELGVDAIVQGSVARADDQVRVTAQLIHGTTDEHLWAQSYQRDLSDVLTLQSEMARTIGREIQAVVSPAAEARLRDARPVDPVAYELTLRGRYSADQYTYESLERAVRLFEQAIAQDPGHAPAHAGLAFAYYSLSGVYFAPLEIMPRARAAAQRAIEIDPGLAEAHTWLGVVHLFFDYDWPAAEREFLTALELNPSSAEAHQAYSNYLLSTGQLTEAVSEVLVGEALAPRTIASYAGVMGSQWTTYLAREFDLSAQKSREALAVDPSNSWAHAYFGLALLQLGDTEEGLSHLEEANRLEEAPLLQALLAYGYAVSAKIPEAQRLLGELEVISRERYTCAYEIAVTHAALGDNDEAFRWLNRARNDRADCIPYLRIDPRFDTIRTDPRYDELIEDIGFLRP